jgi:TRAP-type C4-dicarboxylate transport system substrate-binding protein
MKFLLITTVSGLSLTLGASAFAETWDMPVAYAASNYQTENVMAFAKGVDTCTAGSLTINVHANGSLFKGDEIKRAVQLGEAQIGERLLSAHANENPIFAYDSVPFLASSFATSDALRDAAAPTLEKVLAAQNIHLLYSVPWPPQGLYLSQDAVTPDEIKGMKFRAYNATTARVAELLGMIPTQIEAADLKQALATGVVSSMISSGSTGVDEQVWEDMTTFYDVKAWLPRNTVFVNKDAFAALDQDQQNCLTSEAASAQTRGTKMAEELTDGFVQTLADNGMSTGEAPEAIAVELAAIGQTMTAEWVESAGADGQAIIDAYSVK